MRPTGRVLGILILIVVAIAGCSAAQAQPAPTAGQAYVLELDGPPVGDSEWVTASIMLAGGDYELTWGAGPPFRGEFGSCGSRFGSCQVIVRLVDSKGEWVDGSPALPDLYIDAATDGSVLLHDLAPGEYRLRVQVSCPWRVTLRLA